MRIRGVRVVVYTAVFTLSATQPLLHFFLQLLALLGHILQAIVVVGDVYIRHLKQVIVIYCFSTLEIVIHLGQ